jgi:hypothetical protein
MPISLPNAVVGKVVTRFPPEPSWMLDLGHCKASLMNQYIATQFQVGNKHEQKTILAFQRQWHGAAVWVLVDKACCADSSARRYARATFPLRIIVHDGCQWVERLDDAVTCAQGLLGSSNTEDPAIMQQVVAHAYPVSPKAQQQQGKPPRAGGASGGVVGMKGRLP